MPTADTVALMLLNGKWKAACRERDEATARADALQARLTEAEQHAATAERRGFEAGALVMREAAAREAFSLSGNGKIAAAIRALAPAVPQEGETTS